MKNQIVALPVILTCCVLLAGCSGEPTGPTEPTEPRSEQGAIAWVEEQGGNVDRRIPAQVRKVFLANTSVIDLTPLKEITFLEELDLNDTPVSDLTPLKELANLERLDLTGTQVSEEQVQRLKQALPNCKITGP